MLAACSRAETVLTDPPRVSRVARPCRATPEKFTALNLAAQAAEVCERCPLATACLLDALRIDAAYRRGDDLWGLTGVCAGVAFSPAHPPQRVARTARAGSALSDSTPGSAPGSTPGSAPGSTSDTACDRASDTPAGPGVGAGVGSAELRWPARQTSPEVGV